MNWKVIVLFAWMLLSLITECMEDYRKALESGKGGKQFYPAALGGIVRYVMWWILIYQISIYNV